MNYIGSKYSLLPEIKRALNEYKVPNNGLALDVFSGTCAVGKFLKERGHIVYANDWQYYSYVTSVALLEQNNFPEFTKLLEDTKFRKLILKPENAADLCIHSEGKTIPFTKDIPAAGVLAFLVNLPGRIGKFYDCYCEGGKDKRQYFSSENGKKIQAIRDEIESWKNLKLLNEAEYAWLIACLVESADRVANTASVYGAYLKHIKKSAQKPLRMHLIKPVASSEPPSKNKAFCMDSESLLKSLSSERFNIVYIDPPYNNRQYNANYHILETLARWDLNKFQPHGVTGLREKTENKSDFCSKNKVENATKKLLSLINSDYILFSYNNEGLLSRNHLEKLISDVCSDFKFEEIEYKRFRADLDHSNRVYKYDSTNEYLIIGKMKQN